MEIFFPFSPILGFFAFITAQQKMMDGQDIAYAVFEWLQGPALFLPQMFPVYDRNDDTLCDRPWHCLDVSRVLLLSAAFHTSVGPLALSRALSLSFPLSHVTLSCTN